MSFSILGIGTAHPPDYLTPDDGLAVARVLAGPDVRTSTWLGPVYSGSNIQRRYQVLGGDLVRDLVAGTSTSGSPFLPSPEREGVGPTTAQRMKTYLQEAGVLAFQASQKALQEAHVSVERITHLVTVSCTGFAAPGVDYFLITRLGLPPTVQRTHVGFMGCHGALNGLRVAHAFAAAEPTSCVLLCAVELCSLHYYYGNAADKLIANAIFADGAAAVVGQSQPAAQRGPSPRLVASGSTLIPDSKNDMAWTVGDHGFEMTLSRRVPSLIAKQLRGWLEGWLHDQGLTLSEIGSWAIHPGGPKILSAVQEGLELSDADLAGSRRVLANFGNMSSPTLLFIIDQLRREKAPLPYVALGFGPGLVAEIALFR